MLDSRRVPLRGERTIEAQGGAAARGLAARALAYYERGVTRGRELQLVLADELPGGITFEDVYDAEACLDAEAIEQGIEMSGEQRDAIMLAFNGLAGIVTLAQQRGNAPRENLADWARRDAEHCRRQLVRSKTDAVPSRTRSRARGAGRPRRRAGASSRTSSADPGDPDPASPASAGRSSALAVALAAFGLSAFLAALSEGVAR